MNNIQLIIIAILLAILLPNFAKAQAPKELMIQTYAMQSTKFYIDFKRLSNKEVQNLMAQNPDARVDLDMGITQQTNANVFSFVGGFLIGWPIGSAIGGREINWKIMGVGAVLVGISIPIYAKARKNITTAVSKYNSQLLSYNSKQRNNYSLSLFGVENGAGLRLEF